MQNEKDSWSCVIVYFNSLKDEHSKVRRINQVTVDYWVVPHSFVFLVHLCQLKWSFVLKCNQWETNKTKVKF